MRTHSHTSAMTCTGINVTLTRLDQAGRPVGPPLAVTTPVPDPLRDALIATPTRKRRRRADESAGDRALHATPHDIDEAAENGDPS